MRTFVAVSRPSGSTMVIERIRWIETRGIVFFNRQVTIVRSTSAAGDNYDAQVVRSAYAVSLAAGLALPCRVSMRTNHFRTARHTPLIVYRRFL